MFLDARRRKKKISVSPSVLESVLDVDRLETLSNSAGGLVGGEDALASRGNLLGYLNEFGFELLFGVSLHLVVLLIIKCKRSTSSDVRYPHYLTVSPQ